MVSVLAGTQQLLFMIHQLEASVDRVSTVLLMLKLTAE